MPAKLKAGKVSFYGRDLARISASCAPPPGKVRHLFLDLAHFPVISIKRSARRNLLREIQKQPPLRGLPLTPGRPQVSAPALPPLCSLPLSFSTINQLKMDLIERYFPLANLIYSGIDCSELAFMSIVILPLEWMLKSLSK